MFGLIKKIFGTAQDRQLKQYWRVVESINAWDERFQSLSDEELRAKTDEFKQRLENGETVDDLLPEAYAVVKGVCRRLCGTDVHVSGYDQKWDMIPYDVQLVGSIGMHYGAIAEMMTGEGKTLTATLPLYLNALTGRPVHLVTVNDYLVERDCQWMGAIFRWLGLTTGALTGGTPIHERKNVYASDILYGTASEFGFDYLRDNSIASKKEDQVQRGYYYAIIDEVDSVLIDEARTPLIISGPVPDSRQMYSELKDGVSELVRQQLYMCNRLATEAQKELGDMSGEKLSKGALQKLWIVSKGTPTNKVLKRAKENPVLRDELDKLETFYHGDGNKKQRTETLSELLIIVEERSNDYELTDQGTRTWEENTHGSADDFVMLDLGYEYHVIDADASLSEEEKLEKKVAIREEDALRKERAHNLRQLLRGHLMMERDVDYMVQQSKVIIVDSNTGRPQPGRRFSDGLHQAIEAKEGVAIQQETQTYATVTLQNYFRMYDKLSGMTGTAMTEAGEFKEIYKLDVLEIPTNVPCVRKDANDEVYMTEREKYNSMLAEVKEIHGKGQPILLGTESVEMSEKLARIFRQNKIPHTVLNAKYHEQEAEIIANAGQKGAITIATSMAGRGTDIKLGQGIADLGGLYVIGAARHQSRRIDRQLRGRCARQGDPGSSKFYVSFEDPLMRLFASPRLNSMLKRLRPPEGEPISAGILNRSIETAQKRIEQRNYMVRKHTLEYDDVMNKQRQAIYTFRNDLLHADDIRELARELLQDVVEMAGDEYRGEEYREWVMHHFPVTFDEGAFDDEHLSPEPLAVQAVLEAFDQKIDAQTAESGEIVEQAVRSLMTRTVDQMWQEHLLAMDHLRAEVSLRAVGQKDPLLEFKDEAFILFEKLSQNVRTKIATDLFRFQIVSRDQGFLEELLSKMHTQTTTSHPEVESTAVREALAAKPEPEVNSEPTVGRNDPCPCGSGQKYKKCCGATATSSSNLG